MAKCAPWTTSGPCLFLIVALTWVRYWPLMFSAMAIPGPLLIFFSHYWYLTPLVGVCSEHLVSLWDDDASWIVCCRITQPCGFLCGKPCGMYISLPLLYHSSESADYNLYTVPVASSITNIIPYVMFILRFQPYLCGNGSLKMECSIHHTVIWLNLVYCFPLPACLSFLVRGGGAGLL